MRSDPEGDRGGPAPASARRSALLLGASGLVGRHCLELLLGDRRYDHVVALVRRPLGTEHRQLEVREVDFDRLHEVEELFRVGAVFCCLGTTMRKAGSREAFRRVDVEYPAAAAALAAAAGASAFVTVSAVGANPESRLFYNRAKGEMEVRVSGAGVERTWFVRPSLLLGERREARSGERRETRFGERRETRSEKRTETRSGGRAGTHSGERTETRSGGRAGTHSGERTEAGSGGRTETDSGEGAETDSGERTEAGSGGRSEARFGERLAELALRPVAPLMRGRLRRYRPVHAAAVAASMLELARKPGGGVLESEHIPALAAEYHSVQ